MVKLDVLKFYLFCFFHPGTQVAVLKGGEEHKYAIMKQAIPMPFDNITDILNAVKEKKVTAALLDVYVAAEHSKNLQNLELQEIIEYVFSIGVSNIGVMQKSVSFG